MVQLKTMAQAKYNKNILMHFKGYEDFVSRLLDLEEKAKRYRNIIYTPFFTEKEREIVHQVVKDCFIYEAGGFAMSELKRMAFSMYEEEVDFPIVCLCDRYDEKFHRISHPDVLGALLNLGIERNVVGDIVVKEGVIYLFVEKEMAAYISSHLTMVKRCPITLSMYEGDIEVSKQIEYKQHVVSSYRLDVIVACIARLSREKAKTFIKSGKVKVNQVVLEDYDYLCNNNSTISLRGYGRFTLSYSDIRTKKDRYVIEIGKYV